MDASEFRVYGKQLVDFMADYIENIRMRPVLPTVKPGYLHHLIPDHAPQTPEKWDDIMKDIERVIMPGVTHWSSPYFHAYFPTGNTFPAICGDMLSDILGVIGFSWASCPAATELEMVVTDWLGKMINLPEEFLFSSKGTGGGVIQSTASESTLVSLFAARCKTIAEIKETNENISKHEVMEKLVMYASDQAHSSVEKASILGAVSLRLLPGDKKQSLRGSTLAKAIETDIANGKIPFYVVATLGTTGCCAFDNLEEIGEVCAKYKIWLHVDAAYAGSAFICSEFQYLMKGVEHAESYCFNPHKWLLVNFDCSVTLRHSNYVVNSNIVDPLYLKHEHQEVIPDYRNWHIPLGRRFRSLKLWFVMRMYGTEGMQAYVRKFIRLAHEFESMLLKDDHFEIIGDVIMGIVCFRLKGSDDLNKKLLQQVNDHGKIFIVPSQFEDSYYLRFSIGGVDPNLDDIICSWKEIQSQAMELLKNEK
ncbi:Aromatic-L-amino-acid decarboxylase [Nymphon striatum]|nr:Aromatic-L-amino-acid decarboxylase [Nymphon striatum]